jgi:hypothetical protein
MMPRHRFNRIMIATAACAVAGCAAALWGWLAAPQAFYPAWLAAFWYWLGVPLGALALLMIHDLTGGRWEIVARRPLEACAATMPLFVLAFLPLVAGMHHLYSWSRPEVAHQIRNGWYLDTTFFGWRAVTYFVVWNLLALRQLWIAPGNGVGRPSAWLSGIGLMLMGYTVTLAAVDWLMSIEPDWFSSVYGMMTGAGQFVTALSLVLAVVALGGPPLGMERAAFGKDLANLATILLAVLIFWAYCAYSQWLIIWEENLRFEIPWYLERLRAGWRAVIEAVAVAHFIVPFFLLVWTPAKRSRVLVATACGLVLAAHWLEVWWLVLPPFHDTGFGWLEPLAALGLGGVWACLFLWRLQHGRILPARAAWSLERTING